MKFGAASWRRWLLAALLPVLLIAAVLALQAGHIKGVAQAYLFGYPLVIMDVTRANAALTLGPPNQLQRVRRFPDADFHEVVRPNVDTLYTTAFISLEQPHVFEMAANDARYEVMPFMNAWTDVFAAPGTRSTGTQGGRFLLVGPQWHGPMPAGLTLLRSSTTMVWLIGRTQTNGASDYAIVHGLQDGLRLRSLAAWQAGLEDAPVAWQAAAVKPAPAIEQMKAMPTEEFFIRLALLMKQNPPHAADTPMLAKLASLGLAPGQPPQWGLLERGSAALGRALADFGVARELAQPRNLVRGWSTPPATLGQYGTDYATRAAVAMVGLGANLPQDAIYPNTRVDSTGQLLDGSHRYALHFKASELPPVNAFWSLTAYDAHDFFIANPLQRYALGDRDPLVYNADGSLDLVLQAQPPSADREPNWLPVQAGEPFLLNARLYWPKAAALDGRWGMPAVQRLD